MVTSTTNSNVQTFNTRFGEIAIDTTNVVNFPNGLYGFEEEKNFYLTRFPQGEDNNFLLLQSGENQDLSLLVIPWANLKASKSPKVISKPDLEEAIKSYNFDLGATNTLLITTVHSNHQDNSYKFSVNMKAPIFIDTNNLKGVQHIFYSDDYKILHYLSE